MKQEPTEKQDTPSLADMMITFARATGLRPTELEALRECDVAYESYDSRVYIYLEDDLVMRTVPVLLDHEDEILSIVEHLTQGEHELLFPVLPPDLPYDEARRHYARELYEELLLEEDDQANALFWVMEALDETNEALVKQYCSESLSPHHA